MITSTQEKIIRRAIKILETEWKISETVFDEPANVKNYLRLMLAREEREMFAACYLTKQHRLIETVPLFFGTIDSTAVHPREVVKVALKLNAAAVVFAHNHPSGIAEPSGSDVSITTRLKSVLSEIDVRVLDHFIVTPHGSISMAERQLI